MVATEGPGWMAGLRRLALAALVAFAAGCATNGGDPRDPIEGFNRGMYAFNEGFDQAIGKPVATAYRDAMPDPVRDSVRNFFANIADLSIGLNNLIQGKPVEAITDWVRFAFNTTIGVFGIFDVASHIGLEKHSEDFGQTLGRWGLPDGAYIVWPFIGSSSVRDTGGRIFDSAFDPVANHRPRNARNFMIVTRAIGKRADLLDASRILEEAALDKYVFQRDAYLQRRRNQVYDGSPPRDQREQAPRAEADEPRAQVVRSGGKAQTALRLIEEPAIQDAAAAVSPHGG